MMKQVMVRAWEIAKAAVVKFGGKVREYFAASLSIAWKEIKAMEEIQLVGSEKQIKWAKDIREKLATAFEATKQYANEYFANEREIGVKNDWLDEVIEDEQEFSEQLAALKSYMFGEVKASYYIEKFGYQKANNVIEFFFKNHFETYQLHTYITRRFYDDIASGKVRV